MIAKNYDVFTLTCDICDEDTEGFDTFKDAVDYKKNNGWKNKKTKSGWKDICPECKKMKYDPEQLIDSTQLFKK